MHRVWRLGQWGNPLPPYLSHPFIGVQTHHYQGEVGMGGATSGRTTLTNFTFTKFLDRASCKLLEASCSGQHLKEVSE